MDEVVRDTVVRLFDQRMSDEGIAVRVGLTTREVRDFLDARMIDAFHKVDDEDEVAPTGVGPISSALVEQG